MSSRRTTRITSSFAAFVACCALARAQSTFYVDDDAMSGGDGSSWDAPFQQVQDALAVAHPGDTILVAGGRYQPDLGGGHTKLDRTAAFRPLEGMTLRGGYRGLAPGGDPNDRDLDAFPSILSGDLKHNDPRIGDNSKHVVIPGVGNGNPVVIDGFSIDGGYIAQAKGGGVKNEATKLDVIDCTLHNNLANLGGALYSDAATLSLTRCHFHDDTANDYGAGCHFNGTNATLVDCDFQHEIALQRGGALYAAAAAACSFTRGSFQLDQAPEGGSAYADLATLSFDGTTFGQEFSSDSGGAIKVVDASTLTIVNAAFTGNNAGNGGSICSEGSTLEVRRSTFDHDLVTSEGGSVFARDTVVTLADCTFSHGTCDTNGGAVAILNDSVATIDRCVFTENFNNFGAGGGLATNAPLTLRDSTFTANHANQGGAVQMSEGLVSRCSFRNNDRDPGALYITPGGTAHSTRVVDCLFAQQTAEHNAGITFEAFWGGHLDVLGCTFVDNVSAVGPGAAVDCVWDVPDSITVRNCIFWGNTVLGVADEHAQIEGAADTFTVDYSCLEGWLGDYGGTGNHGADPLFVDRANGDDRLTLNSPCVEAGDPSFVVDPGFEKDLALNPRVLDAALDRSARVDMGALEFSNVHLAISGSFTPGGTVSVDTDGTAGLPAILVFGTNEAPLDVRPFGFLFVAIDATTQYLPWPAAPSHDDEVLPDDLPVPLDLVAQVAAMNGVSGNLSNVVKFTIE